MTKWIGVALAVVTCVFCVGAAQAAWDLDITASYKGNVKKTSGEFTNTTKASGVCSEHPAGCAGLSSIILPWDRNSGKNLNAPMGWKKGTHTGVIPDHMYLAWDAGYHQIQVHNARTGAAHMVRFRIPQMGMAFKPSVIPYHGDKFDGPNCRNLDWFGVEWLNVEEVSLQPGRAECSKHFDWSVVKVGDRIPISYVSIGYFLALDKPWTWEPGIYKGTFPVTVGRGKMIDFGNNFEGSAGDFNINFTLTVTPDMYVHFNTGAGGVVNTELQPPGGWLHWQGKMPPYLSSDVPFDFGATGPVKIHLANCDHAVDDTCGIVDLQRGGSALGVDAMLTDNYVTDDSGKRALNTRLSTKERVFKPVNEGGSGSQRAHLLLRTRDGVTQQMQRGHHYGGHMTVVFDSEVNN
ncbi:hypothetical protein [Burkholderia vietnamiensis]|uniref:hypothetical protein n=1 Tax=Burkholderia vietnamiensis TaxID=60552 RepID=UPI0012D91478|nr:hypothetical protein [Burkholderia vietnamiensis]MCA8180526.1 hypothetical protein [Burkholderia vietnamiensis]